MPVNHKERREYYRINDVLGLSYQVIEAHQPQLAIAQASDNLGLPIKNLLAEIDRELNQVTNTLWHEHPTMGQAVGLLNRKLSIIAAHYLSGEEDDSIDSYEQLMVNISGNGIAFDCDENLSVGTALQLSLQLKPSNTLIEIKGSVVRTESRKASAKKPFWIRVCFDETEQASQEQLIQHIVQKQCAQMGYKAREKEEEQAADQD